MKATLRLLMIAIALAGIGFAAYRLPDWLNSNRSEANTAAVYTVERRTIEDRVVERGTVESQNTVYGKCELPGWQNKIISIKPEGTIVKKGDVVAQLEAEEIDRSIAEKEVELNEAKGKLEQAKQELRYKTPSAGVGSSLSAQDLNADIVIPLTTDRSRIGDVIEKREQGSFSRQRLELSQITIEVVDRFQVKSTAAAVESLIAKFHTNKDYALTVPLDLLEQAQATQRIFNFVLGATAAISLLVGGIGIMNIMLATVSERTREIGIRRALGAKQSDIILQFLIETASLSLFGTALGVVIGVAVPGLVGYFAGMETLITPWSIAVAAIVSLTVGIVFGIYPARQAARLDPIEALRRG